MGYRVRKARKAQNVLLPASLLLCQFQVNNTISFCVEQSKRGWEGSITACLEEIAGEDYEPTSPTVSLIKRAANGPVQHHPS